MYMYLRRGWTLSMVQYTPPDPSPAMVAVPDESEGGLIPTESFDSASKHANFTIATTLQTNLF